MTKEDNVLKIPKDACNLLARLSRIEGVTALCFCHIQEQNILISGDQEGNIALWNLKIFRKINSFKSICPSRIQALKCIKLTIDQRASHILVAQSRDNGVYLIRLADDLSESTMSIIRVFPSFPSLFSRLDVISSDDSCHAILAYPSQLGSDLITVRYLTENVETIVSGTATRDSFDKKSTKSSVFDIRLQKADTNTKYHLFVGYEDGLLCCFAFTDDNKIDVPELGVTGLRIELLMKIDTHFKDFISAFDLTKRGHNSYNILCGGPKKEIVKLDCDLESQILNSRENIPLRRQGVSSLKIRQDGKVYAVAGWDNSLAFIDLEDHKELYRASHFLDQVQDILFIKKTAIDDEFSDSDHAKSAEQYYLCTACLDCTINIFEPT